MARVKVRRFYEICCDGVYIIRDRRPFGGGVNRKIEGFSTDKRQVARDFARKLENRCVDMRHDEIEAKLVDLLLVDHKEQEARRSFVNWAEASFAAVLDRETNLAALGLSQLQEKEVGERLHTIRAAFSELTEVFDVEG